MPEAAGNSTAGMCQRSCTAGCSQKCSKLSHDGNHSQYACVTTLDGVMKAAVDGSGLQRSQARRIIPTPHGMEKCWSSVPLFAVRLYVILECESNANFIVGVFGLMIIFVDRDHLSDEVEELLDVFETESSAGLVDVMECRCHTWAASVTLADL